MKIELKSLSFVALRLSIEPFKITQKIICENFSLHVFFPFPGNFFHFDCCILLRGDTQLSKAHRLQDRVKSVM